MVCGTIHCSGLGGPSGCMHLALTGKLRGLHLVFHISLLRRYEPSGDRVKPPPPIVADEEEVYDVKALLSHQV